MLICVILLIGIYEILLILIYMIHFGKWNLLDVTYII